MLKPNNYLKATFDILGLRNLVTFPTCFKSKQPTVTNLLVTNVPKRIKKITCIDSGLTDYHKIVCWATKIKVPARTVETVHYRGYKYFDELKYQHLGWTESCRFLRNFPIRNKQNRVDQSVPLLRLVLTKPLQRGLQGSVPSVNQSVTNGVVWRTGETFYAE